ncbi:MAG: HD domain-containing protein [Thermodesulfobacteriota bacterium]
MDYHQNQLNSEQSNINWKRLAEFFFEVGMLRKTPRTGYQFLGSGSESVAEHSFRTTVIGYSLARLSGADWTKVVLMCLFHDLKEARIGDFNYVNRMYNTALEDQALRDSLLDTGLEEAIHSAHEEMEKADSLEASLAQDADQLDFILNLKEQKDLGNPYGSKWLYYALKRLRTEFAEQMASRILQTDHTDWWFKSADDEWWAVRNGSDNRNRE